MLPNNSAPVAGPYGFAGARPYCQGKKKRISGMAWLFIGLLIFFIGAGVLSSIVKRVPRNLPQVTINAPRSVAGVDDWDNTDGGVTFDYIETPGGPADKAGLVGGDVITTVDGQPVHSVDEMREIMRRIPIGNTVDVVYLRDGETKTTKLTTISQEESGRLEEAFAARPEGRAQFGYDDDDAERVEIPNTKLFGVKLGTILASRPADMAGIREGDIVIAWDDIPIRTAGEFLHRVRRAVPYSTVKLTIIRDGQQQVIPVKMGRQG
jgi:S1-C subfamily serine protease